MQHLSSDIASFHVVSNVSFYTAFKQYPEFASHAGAGTTFQACAKSTMYNENVLLAAARSMPLFAMSFKP